LKPEFLLPNTTPSHASTPIFESVTRYFSSLFKAYLAQISKLHTSQVSIFNQGRSGFFIGTQLKSQRFHLLPTNKRHYPPSAFALVTKVCRPRRSPRRTRLPPRPATHPVITVSVASFGPHSSQELEDEARCAQNRRSEGPSFRGPFHNPHNRGTA